MNLVLALLLLAQPEAAESADDEIVVIARKFEKATVIVGKDPQGSYTCNLTVTSGNARLDERLCRTATKCVIKGAKNGAAVKACIDRKKPGIFAAFRQEWLKGQHR